MGCIYDTWKDGCSLCQDVDKDQWVPGVDNKGFCIVEDDPDPGYTCDMYESDYTCPECGADLNIEECICDEEDY